jgi:hypothetical protein
MLEQFFVLMSFSVTLQILQEQIPICITRSTYGSAFTTHVVQRNMSWDSEYKHFDAFDRSLYTGRHWSLSRVRYTQYTL